MQLLAKTLHVLAVGLWFGSSVFFMISTLLLFRHIETRTSISTIATPGGLEQFREDREREKAMNTRLVGSALSDIFPWFFAIQGCCGTIVALTAWSWSRAQPSNIVHRARAAVAVLALSTVVVAWPLTEKVSGLRLERYHWDPAVAEAAKVAFGTWHGYSLLLSLVTLAFVTVLMALAAQLPAQFSPKSKAAATE